MGGSSYSDDMYSLRADTRAKRGTPAFDYDHKVKTGATARKVHEKLDPRGVTREARDSDAHPDSLPIGVLFDVTGSMGSVPVKLQAKLPQLMGLLLRKGYVKDPQVLFAAVGDYFADKGPLQVGQFESGLEMDDDLSRMWLEGGGGGSQQESYQLGMYFFARHTVSDAWEKRRRKGYLFIIGDEQSYHDIKPPEAAAVFGDALEGPLATTQIVEELKERYHVFFLIPEGAAHTHAGWLTEHWKTLLGPQQVIMLDKPEDVAEIIAGTIGICEGTTDLERLKDDIHDVGSSGRADAVTTALAPLAKHAPGPISKADIPVADAPDTNQRI